MNGEWWIRIVVFLLFWPFFWWNSNRSITGQAPIEKEAERFWLKFALIGLLLVGAAFLALNRWKP